ncbi:alpha/beta hydrolase [Frigidibacter sp. ROC022]|uniref:alpha/beta hydrolase n=1 Tax=Frigidibacter sp. ROC022 TaxID=2971796 RepID=UPI00215B0808|nr:alpha/beta fold hydrolase [Frigidibacter sp. ROC022]MCR8724652.1 alpha/beta fold hydrolase [Frigidibacter sp. ROC022]
MEHSLTFMSDGLKLAGVLHVPDDRKPGERLPTFIVLHGFVGTKDKSHVEIISRMIADMGYCVFRMDFRGCGESEGARGEVRCFDQVADTRNAVTFLSEREEVDPARIGVTGHSFGAAVAIFAGGVDERIACVVSFCGWGDGERKFRRQHPTPEAWEKFTGILEKGRKHKAETGESLWVSRFDVVPIPPELRGNLSPKAQFEVPVETAISMYSFRADDVVGSIAPRPLLLFHTAHDVITPMEESLRLFEKAGANAELMIPTGVSHFPVSDQDRPHTQALVEAWLKKFFPSPKLAAA